MNFLYKYIIRSNIFISLCACCFYLSGKILLEENPFDLIWEILAIIFLGTFLTYHISQSPLTLKKERRDKSVQKLLLFFMIISILAYLGLNLPLKYLAFFVVLGFLSLLYNSIRAFNFLPLRSIPFLKIFLIAFVWSSIGAILPFFQSDSSISLSFFLVFLSQFFFILAITLPFDIRDFYKDYKSNLKTLPSVLGIKRTKYLAYFTLTLHFTGILMINYLYILAYLPLLLLAVALIQNSSSSKPNFYYIFYIDGLIILQFLILYLSYIIF